jgi:hypothetical protein
LEKKMKQRLSEVVYFPIMVAVLAWQLLYFALTEVETFLVVVVSVLFGYHFGVMWGLTVFFSIYLIMRMVGGYVGLLANKLDWIGQSIARRK